MGFIIGIIWGLLLASYGVYYWDYMGIMEKKMETTITDNLKVLNRFRSCSVIALPSAPDPKPRPHVGFRL